MAIANESMAKRIAGILPVAGNGSPMRRSEGGVAAVEFALVLPLLLIVIIGTIDFGFMVYDKAMITNAAREGARAGIVLRNPRLSKAEIETVATNYCRDNLITLIGNTTCRATAVVPNPIRSQAAAPDSPNSRLEVSVEYEYQGPIVSLVSLIPGASLTLGTMRSTAEMKYE